MSAQFGIMCGDEGRKAGVTETRRKFFAIGGGYPPPMYFSDIMNNDKTEMARKLSAGLMEENAVGENSAIFLPTF